MTLVLVSEPLLQGLTHCRLGLGPGGFGISDQDEPRLRPNCNNMILTEKVLVTSPKLLQNFNAFHDQHERDECVC